MIYDIFLQLRDQEPSIKEVLQRVGDAPMGVEIFSQILAKGLIDGWIFCKYIHLGATGETIETRKTEFENEKNIRSKDLSSNMQTSYLCIYVLNGRIFCDNHPSLSCCLFLVLLTLHKDTASKKP